MPLRALILGLVLLAPLSTRFALAEPAPLHIEGEITTVLTALDDASAQAYRHDRITHITFHHEGFAGTDAALFKRASAAREKQSIAQRVRNIDHYHANQAGLGMIAYHYVIDKQGRIAKGRPVRFKPATRSTALGSSSRADFAGHVAVMVLGDFNHERLTRPSRRSLVRIMSEAQRTYRVPTSHIQPHLDHAHTLCPGKHMADEAESLRQMVQAYSLQSELVRRGCTSAPPDGVWGRQSRDAFGRYVRQNAGHIPGGLADDAALFAMLNAPDRDCR